MYVVPKKVLQHSVVLIINRLVAMAIGRKEALSTPLSAKKFFKSRGKPDPQQWFL